MLLIRKEGEPDSSRLPGSDAVRPRHRRYFSSIPAASPTGDRHDDQADDGVLPIRGPAVPLGRLRSTARTRCLVRIYAAAPASDTYQQDEGHATRPSRRPHGDGVASIVFERPSTAIAASPLPARGLSELA